MFAQRADGSIFTAHIGVSVLQVADQTLYASYVTDVTSVVETRNQVEARIDDISGVLGTFSDCLLLVDRQGTVVHANASVQRVLFCGGFLCLTGLFFLVVTRHATDVWLHCQGSVWRWLELLKSC